MIMASGAETYTDSTNMKLRELLKEVQLDYSPENTSVVDGVVSAIRDVINSIPDGLPVKFWTTQLFLCYRRLPFAASLNLLMLFFFVKKKKLAANFGRLQLMLLRGLFEMLALIKWNSSLGSQSP